MINSLHKQFLFHSILFFFTETYDYLNVNANGWVGWDSENATVWENGDLPSSSMPRPAIFGFFDDLNPNNDNGNSNASGDIYYHTNEDRVVVWFDDVVRWEGTAGSGTYNFQIVLYSDGRFKCNYDQMQDMPNGQKQKVAEVKLEKPIKVLFEGVDTDVYYPREKHEMKSDFKDELDELIKEDFAYLHVGQWGKGGYNEDRKNIPLLIKNFINQDA